MLAARSESGEDRGRSFSRGPARKMSRRRMVHRRWCRSQKPLHSDWLPVCGFHPGPEPTLAPTLEAVDTCAVATPSLIVIQRVLRGKHLDDRELLFS